jgi:Ca-activated chloride channel family protein
MTTQRELENTQVSNSPKASRRRLILATVLLAATLAAGAAAHRIDGWVAPPPVDPGALSFQAPGSGPVHFSGQLDRGSVLAGSDGIVKMELVLRGDERRGEDMPRVPTDVVVILDRSGSMQGEPLATPKASVRALLAQLADDDRFALVSYATGVRLEWPLDRATGHQRQTWRNTLAGVQADGGTNMAVGIDLANQILSGGERSGRAARVVLLSDGHANQGDHSLAGLRRRASRAVQGEWVFSTAGVGQGFDESLMASLADAGAGNFYYVQHAENLASVFADEFASARETVAKALTVSIRPGSGIEVVDAAGYPLERSGSAVQFRPGDLFAGQERRIWVTLRTPTSGEGEYALGRFAVSYRGSDGREERVFSGTPQVACVKGEDEYFADVDSDAWVRSSLVDEIGELKQKVSRAVQRGDRGRALYEIQDYRAKKERVNAVLKRPEVAAALDDLSLVETEVEEAFNAPAEAAPALQNGLGKQLAADGYNGRRSGAKRK